MTIVDDRALVARMLHGDAAAFEEFFATCFPPLYRFASARMQDPAAVEDVVQATLSRAVARLDTYRGEAALLTWLFTFCRHEISAWFAQQARRPAEVELAEDMPEVRAALESLASAPAGPQEALAHEELRHAVQATLDALPRRYGDALEWKYIEGLPVVEVAARLGVSAKAAESLLTRARQAFRDAFLALPGSLDPSEAE